VQVSRRGRSAVARVLVLTVAAGIPLVVPVGAAAGAGDIATFAGGVGAGTATQVKQVPEGLALSGSNLYISDTNLSVVRVLDTGTGRETVLAGNGTWGYSGDGGPATQAQLSHPTGIALDSRGDVFISDSYNNRVREVKPNGIITTVAGISLGGSSGDGGPATSAQLFMPLGLAVDTHDNLFIADRMNNAIRKVDMTTGIIQTVVGGGLLNWPADVTFDIAGDMFIADPGNARIARVNAGGGAPYTIAGGGTGGPCSGCSALSAGLFGVQGVTVDAAGNLLVADTNAGLVRRVNKLDGTGTITTVAGGGPGPFGGDGGPATKAALYNPMAVRAYAAGELFIADKGNGRVRKVDAGQTITTVAGTGGCGYAGDGGWAGQAQLCGPRGMALDATGALFIADGEGARIRKVDAGGTISTVAGNGLVGYSGDGGPATQATLNVPESVALDAAGDLFIADTDNDVVREVTPDGLIHTVVGNHTRGYSGDGGLAINAALDTPTGVTFDTNGNLLIADLYNDRIRIVNHTTQIITTIAGTGVRGSAGDGGPATSAQLSFPAGVAIDTNGAMFIADSGNDKIRKVDPSGNISTVAGSLGAVGLGDGGPALQASLVSPFAVAIGPQHVLYIDDSQNQRIRMVTADGIIHTAAGNGQLDARGFSGDGGPATAAALNDPYGLAIDSAGNLFIGDTGNHRVRRVEAYGLPGAPTNVVATGVSGGATVTWSAPPSGGRPIVSYTVTPYDAATPGTPGPPTTVTGSPAPTTATVTGLIKFHTYTFVVTAANDIGAGPPSQASNSITVYLAPAAPVAVHAAAGVASAQVSWTVPVDDGGKPILSYRVTPYQGSIALASSTVTAGLVSTTIMIPGLTNGTFYTFTVAATNQMGTGAPSTSNAVRPMGGGTYHPLPPARILDTRSAIGGHHSPLAPSTYLSTPVTEVGGVPRTGVSAVVVNVTVTNTTAASYLTVWPAGMPRPLASNLNWTAGKTVTNLVEVAVGAGDMVSAYNAAGNTDVIFDVQGWVDMPGNPAADGLFNGLAPARILDTRDGTGGTTHALGANGTLNLQVAGSVTSNNAPSGVPATGVSAVVLNVTVANPSQPSYLTVYPAGSARPVTSNLNFTAGQTVANRVIVKLGAGGAISIYNAGGNVNVIADVNGWFTDATNTSGGTDFSGISPSRLLDTRTPSGGGALQGGYDYMFQLLDSHGAPLTGISAIVVNVTATNSTAAGYLTLWPNTVTLPLASDLNFLPGQTVPNLVVLQLGANASFRIYNAAGDTDVVMDVVGYYGTQDAAVATSGMRTYSQALRKNP
jgi:hypothetical protein